MTNQAIRAALRERQGELRGVCADIHANPELGLREFKASAWLRAALASWGFAVEAPFGGLETAFKASWGEGGACFCFIAEYDALADLGHGCGHNLIATAALGAAAGLQAALRQASIAGRVVVVGTPAEEGKGGKVSMLRHNAFAGVDAALLAHPFARTLTDAGCLGNLRFEVAFHGRAAHAAAAPERGRNALDAALLLFQGVNAWRQQLSEPCRVHGVIVNGGASDNVIPDLAAAKFVLRAQDDATLAMMRGRFLKMVEGAALMTATEPELKESDTPYRAGLVNPALNRAFLTAAADVGLEPSEPSRGGRFSTDFGNVSQTLPCAHVFFGLADPGMPELHTVEFARAAGTDAAFAQALLAAEAVAQVGLDYLSDPAFRAAVTADFASRGV